MVTKPNWYQDVEYLREARRSDGHAYTEVWLVPPPRRGQSYRVLWDEWNHDDSERRIHLWISTTTVSRDVDLTTTHPT